MIFRRWIKQHLPSLNDYMACYGVCSNLKSFRIMSATDILWPRPRLCYFHSYMIYYINFMCFYHLSRDCCCWCESLSCWGRKQTLPDSLTPTLRPPHPPPPSSSVEIWCIMYVNDTKFHLTLLLHPYDLPQEKTWKRDDIFIQDNLNLLDS